MSRFQKYILAIAIASNLSSCKTVKRDDLTDTMSDVAIRLPEKFSTLEAHATFIRIDGPSNPRSVKGKNLTIALPVGTYSVELVLLNPDGTEEYKSCDTSRPYVFTNPKETAIIDICKQSDRSIVVRTLPDPSTVVAPTAGSIGPNPPILPNPVVAPNPDPISVTPDKPKFAFDGTCFGLPATATLEGTEVVLKMTGEIKDKLIDNLSYLHCDITLNIPKPKGKIYSPLSYQMIYTADDKTLKQSLWFAADGRDENGKLSLPCNTFVFNAASNSKKDFICSFYDTSPEHLLEVFPKFKADHDASCLSESSSLILAFTVAGPTRAWISSLKIPEFRVQLPQVEACP